MQHVVPLAVRGVVGFGIGGALAALFSDAMLFGFLLAGALSGATLGSAFQARTALLLPVASSLGLFMGTSLAFFVVLAVWEPPLSRGFIGAMGGALTGVAIGVVLRRKDALLGLPVAGAVGFGVGWLVAFEGVGAGLAIWPLLLGGPSTFAMLLQGATQGIVGGALLGAATGYLERARTVGA